MKDRTYLEQYNQTMQPAECGFDPNDISFVSEIRSILEEIAKSKCEDCNLLKMLADQAIDDTIDYIRKYHDITHEPSAEFIDVVAELTDDDNIRVEFKSPQTPEEIKEAITAASEELEELASAVEDSVSAIDLHRNNCKGVLKLRAKRDNTIFLTKVCTAPILEKTGRTYPSATIAIPHTETSE
jgi:hypothetical protein